jgi:hypothetical protein
MEKSSYETHRLSHELDLLSLPLLVTGVHTDDTHHPFSADQFALFTNPSDTRTHFHANSPVLILFRMRAEASFPGDR